MIKQIEEIKQLIRKAKTAEAVDALNRLTKNNAVHETPAILISAAFSEIKQHEINNTLSPEQINLNKSQLNRRIMLLVETFQISDFEEKESEKQGIFYIGSTPIASNMDLRKEIIDIDNGLKKYDKRRGFQFNMKMNVQANEIINLLYELDPEPRFLHFAGHAVYDKLHPEYGTGLLFEDSAKAYSLVKGERFGKIISQWQSVECVFLNACHSAPVANQIAKYIPYVIGMRSYITDDSAIAFAIGFYNAIANKKNIPDAFELGLWEIEMNGFVPEEKDTPVLIEKGKYLEESLLWDQKDSAQWEADINYCYQQKLKNNL